MGALRARKQTEHFGLPVSSAIPFCIGKKNASRAPKRSASAATSPLKPDETQQQQGGTRRRDPKIEFAEIQARKIAYKAKQHMKKKAMSDSETSS